MLMKKLYLSSSNKIPAEIKAEVIKNLGKRFKIYTWRIDPENPTKRGDSYSTDNLLKCDTVLFMLPNNSFVEEKVFLGKGVCSEFEASKTNDMYVYNFVEDKTYIPSSNKADIIEENWQDKWASIQLTFFKDGLP